LRRPEEVDWDDEKDLRNQAKHGVAFRDAAKVFLDPRHQTRSDFGSPVGDPRWQTVGTTPEGILFVVHAEQHGDVVRIISARKADKIEQADYRSGTFGD
jgi:uncharacterized DUF497 family protein